MRTSKIIILIFMFFIFAFIHVFLQTEIIKLGYQIKKNEDKYQELIDNNYILKYNIYTLESPYRLNKYASLKNSNLKILKPAQVYNFYPESKSQDIKEVKRKSFLFDSPLFLVLRRFFTGRQAEAKTIK